MKTNVEISTSGKLYLVCTIEKGPLYSTSVEILQKAFARVHLNAKTVRSGDALVIIINLENTSADFAILETIKSTVFTVIFAAQKFQAANMKYQEKLSALAKDLYEATKPTTSPTEESNCKGQ